MPNRKALFVLSGVLASMALAWWIAPPSAARFARYRFPVGKPTLEFDEIAALERRTKEMPGRGIDLADLALRYVNQAKARADRALYDRAAETAKRSLEILSVGNPGAHVALAKVAESAHEFETAIEEARKALKDSPDSSGAWSVLVSARLAKGEIREAAVAADTLVALRPTTGHRAYRALTLLAQNRETEAIAEFQLAFKLEGPDSRTESAWARALLARHWLYRGKLREAEWTLKEALRIAPESDLAHSILAEVLLRRGDPAGGETEARRALELSPQPRYLRQLALALGAKGDRTGAEGYLREAELLVRGALAREGVGHRLDLVQILLDRGGSARAEEAVELAREETMLRPSGDAYFWLARALGAAGRTAFALAAAEEALRRGERQPERYRFAAELHRQLKHAATADLYERLGRG